MSKRYGWQLGWVDKSRVVFDKQRHFSVVLVSRRRFLTVFGE